MQRETHLHLHRSIYFIWMLQLQLWSPSTWTVTFIQFRPYAELCPLYYRSVSIRQSHENSWAEDVRVRIRRQLQQQGRGKKKTWLQIQSCPVFLQLSVTFFFTIEIKGVINRAEVQRITLHYRTWGRRQFSVTQDVKKMLTSQWGGNVWFSFLLCRNTDHLASMPWLLFTFTQSSSSRSKADMCHQPLCPVKQLG